MKKRRMTTNPSFWLTYKDGSFDEVYYGNDEQCEVRFTLSPLNSGKIITLHGIHHKDMDNSGTWEQSYLKIFNKKNCNDYGTLEKIYEIGDIPFDTLIKFAVSIILIYAPTIVNRKKMQEILKIEKW